jgi:HK97 family phage major capsid protein
MSTILNLRDKRANAWEKAKTFLDASRDENGLVSPENSARYEAMEKDILALGEEITRLERQAALDAEMSAPTSTPIVNAPVKATSEMKEGRATDEYKRDFFDALRGRPITNLLQTKTDADGGFTVPIEFERQIVAALDENNIIRHLAKVVTTAAPRKIPMAGTPSVASWVDEAASIPESTVTFGQKSLDAYKLTNLIKISMELLQDSMFDLSSYIATEIARAFAAAEEEAFAVGNGVGKPTGIFTADGGTLGVTAASATAITFDELIALVYKLKTPYRSKAVFLMNDSTISMIRKLKDANSQYLWQVGLQVGQPDRLLGYPVYTSPYVPALGAGALTVAFGDLSNFWIADRAGRTVQRLNELYAQNGLVGYVASQRVDGKVILSEGIQLLKMHAGA